MPSLLELQRQFAGVIEDAAAASAPGFEVYRHAIAANYRRALGATYPVVRALVGAGFFDAAVDAFVARHPPLSGDLNVYGARLAGFLATYGPASTLPYLRDVARLEWALDESARAADSALDPRSLAAVIAMVDEDAVPGIQLRLHPSCRLLATGRAVFDLWRAHQPRHQTDTPGDIGGIATEHLLVRRQDETPCVERLGAGEFAWLRALQDGESFGPALARAMEADQAFDLGEALSSRVMDGTLSGLAS